MLHDKHDHECGRETDSTIAVNEHLATLVDCVVNKVPRSVKTGKRLVMATCKNPHHKKDLPREERDEILILCVLHI
jgi:hypothetical protein